MPVGPLECSAATEDSITLSWQPPASNGGSPLTGYIVEKSDVRRPKWVRVGKVPADQTSTSVESLLENVGYFFRVMAENKVGASPPLENEVPFKPKSPYGEFIWFVHSFLCVFCFFKLTTFAGLLFLGGEEGFRNAWSL